MRPLAVVLALIALGACSYDDGGRSDTNPTPAEIAQCMNPGVGVEVPEAVGLEEEDLDAFAESRACTRIRVIGRDGDCADRTDDLLADRLNVYIVRDAVVSAYLF